jgi:hypothetical protein
VSFQAHRERRSIQEKSNKIPFFEKPTSSPYSRWASCSLKKVREKLSVVTNRSSPYVIYTIARTKKREELDITNMK